MGECDDFGKGMRMAVPSAVLHGSGRVFVVIVLKRHAMDCFIWSEGLLSVIIRSSLVHPDGPGAFPFEKRAVVRWIVANCWRCAGVECSMVGVGAFGGGCSCWIAVRIVGSRVSAGAMFVVVSWVSAFAGAEFARWLRTFSASGVSCVLGGGARRVFAVWVKLCKCRSRSRLDVVSDVSRLMSS